MRLANLDLLFSVVHDSVSAAASAVHTLNSINFDSFVKGHELSMVAFIAPWCRYCQDLEPEFEAAAATAQDQGWPLVRVDCDEERALCERYRVNIYPTIRIFHGTQQTIYNGRRTSDAMITVLKRYSRAVVTVLSSPQEVAEFSTQDRVAVVGYFDEDDEASNTAFSAVAKTYRDEHLFASISNNAFGQVEDVKKPSVVLYKKFDEGKNLYTGDFDAERIKSFIRETATPLIREVGVNFHSFPTKFGGYAGAIIFAETKDQRANLVATLRPVAEATKDQIVWVIADPVEHAQRASQVGLKPGAWPAFAIEDPGKGFKFAFPKRGSTSDLTSDTIQQVVDDFLAGRLPLSSMDDSISPLGDFKEL